MSTSDRTDRAGLRIRAAIAASTLALIALAACGLAPDHCLRMSDCGDGTSCIDGLCAKADDAASANVDPDASSETGTSVTTDATTSTSTTAAAQIDGATGDASSDGASDGALTDATDATTD